ncbi:gamma-glutamylcyclotransferase family protein [Methylocapsa acidiphila]|uniref:gamma-glutamylcyclotransferase family protein n=1 Tax=Methylocapsa acidiphila TaxID=133552 RepID=UPI00040D82D0|nr:gamma-glutamylcyclotransferase family protein [Methylocapsa acidiphila]
MPLYFAYGSNMDAAAMRGRCPKARAIGRARLAGHRFFIMAEGFASVRCDRNAEVHGILYELALSDIGPLDRYEEIARGLYHKISQPVLRVGGGSVRALVYVGRNSREGRPSPSYMESIIGAANAWALPRAYISFLESLAGLRSDASDEKLDQARRLDHRAHS